MHEDEKVAKARRQLIIVGVVCVTIVVLALWLVSLPRTLARNRAQHNSTASVKEFFQQELTGFRK